MGSADWMLAIGPCVFNCVMKANQKTIPSQQSIFDKRPPDQLADRLVQLGQREKRRLRIRARIQRCTT